MDFMVPVGSRSSMVSAGTGFDKNLFFLRGLQGWDFAWRVVFLYLTMGIEDGLHQYGNE